ncbi:putative O-glycosylation ligase, exosortase A system-associated [Rheinheimera salexigens]|uniref:Putative O-glycosylation ligase, exosortase A system-associated n=1 Tax=Rheinheimera salexigens TaxID=1628148 RepID=A0A1E7Q703_9GAMM|nr:putative O-glycosylation ligase, exosortase A system-associated [Rheinheimera salexigens]OEY69974.1 putative O-glycosylation ligase, exosortase A system-associated [Rheinheimera salexigens]
MRDLLLVLFLFVAIFYSFKRPFIGIAAWAWIALIAPANWAFGFSNDFRLNLTIVVVTVLSYLFMHKNKKLAFNGLSFWILLFAFWTLLSSLNAVNSPYAVDYWYQFIKVLLFYLFITLIVTKKLHLDTLIWAIVLAISSYAAMEAVKVVLSGGSHMVRGRSGALLDRNDFAVAVNMCLPLILYLIFATKHHYLKLGLWGLFFGNIIAIVGTGSRGGFIGLSILAIAIWWKSKRKLLWLILTLLILPSAYQFTPEEWRERQNTIQTASTEDASFIGRLWAWKISVMLARDNPMLGGGFGSVSQPIVWYSYAPYTPDFGPIKTPLPPPNMRPKAAHNIYFQVLGDHGYVGLFIYLMMFTSIFWINRRNGKLAIKHNQPWCKNLSDAIALSMVGYCVTGNNVSLAYFDLLYVMGGIVAVISIYKLYLPQSKLAPPSANSAFNVKSMSKA